MLETTPSLAPASPPSLIHFFGIRAVFSKIALRGALLELVTLGFYRFWLLTDIRRHLWAHTSVGGDSAEYTGRARELLLGFLFAMAILIPVYFLYFLAGLEAERLQAFASVPLFIFLYLFMQFAVYRARRYRVTRTVWRGLRLSMRGSGWAYAWRAALWGLLVVFTTGLALPWRQAALERYKMRHTSYGSLQGSFEATGLEFFKRGWWLWLLTPFALFSIIGLPFIIAGYRAIEWRWWVSGMRFGDVTFDSYLHGGDLLAPYWKVIGWGVGISTALSAAFTGISIAMTQLVAPTAAPEEQIIGVMQHPAFLLSAGFLYLLSAVLFGAVMRIYLMRDIWAIVASTSVAYNLHAADDVEGQGTIANALGEGLADGLDFGGF